MRVDEVRQVETKDAARGRELGVAVREAALDALERYRQAYPQLGIPTELATEVAATSLLALEEWDADQAEELAGVAEGVGVPLADLMLLNARTEILAHAPLDANECSTVVALHGDARPQTMQTWDWHAELAPIGVLIDLTTEAGMRVRTFSEPGMLAKIGVNDAGLGLHFNILHHASDRRAGVPVHAIARRILTEASSVDEAVTIARSAQPGASTVLTVVAHGRAACIELSPAGVGVVEPDGDLLVHTNHFVDPELAQGEATTDASTTYMRYEHAAAQREALLAADGAVELATSMCGEAGADAPVCVLPTQDLPLAHRWETLLTASLDVDACAIDWFAGPPSGLTAETVRRFG